MEHFADRAHLGAASGQWRLEPVDALRAADVRHDPYGPPQVLRLGLSLESVLTLVLEADRARRQPARGRVDVDGSRRGGGLDAGGGVDRIAGDHAFVCGADRDRYVARDHPGSRPEAVGSDLEPQLVNRLDQVECSANAPLGVLLGRHRSAPHCHHGIADELLDHAAVAGDDGLGDVEVAGQQFANVLWVTRLRDRGETDQIAEQHRAHASLGDRLIGWRLRRGIGRRCRVVAQLGSTVAAEALVVLDSRAARRAGSLQLGPAVTAEILVDGVVRPAPSTPQTQTSPIRINIGRGRSAEVGSELS